MAVDDGPGERDIENTLLAERAPLACIFLDAILRHVRTGGVVMLEVDQRRRTRVVEPMLHPREVAHARGMRQIVRQRPDTGEERNDVWVCVRERELDRLRWRRLTLQDRGIQVEQSAD